MNTRVSVIIPNWNGEAFLARCLAGVVQSCRASGERCEILLVDDASTDKSCDIAARFPQVRVVAQKVNRGFGPTVNHGANEARGEFLVLLNNDLVPGEAMIRELVRPLMDNRGVFGVSGKTVDWNESKPNHLCMWATWARGNFELRYSDPAGVAPAMFLQGGSCSMRRDVFLQFGGFSHLFSPGYWEDYDISYLALKSGWQNLYNPKAHAWHFGQGSMRRALGDVRLARLRERNRLLFTWLNVTDRDLLAEHCRRLPRYAGAAMWRGEDARTLLPALLAAMRRARTVAAERGARMTHLKHTDREVLERFANEPGQPA